MKKGIFIIVAALVVVSAVTYQIYKKSSNQQAAITQTSTSTDLPWLSLTQLDGTKLVTKSLEGKTILVFFQPDCDHCQREATEISEHLDAFAQHQVYFVSDAELTDIGKFAQEYGLTGNSKVHFAQASANDIYNAVGAIQVPAVYVYSDKGRLVKSFIGETPIQQILNFL